MVDLPNEIIHQIIQEIRSSGHLTGLRSLACVNRSWQMVAESYIWQYLRIKPREIDCFRSVFSANTRRRRALKHLDIRFEYYFAQRYRTRAEQESADYVGSGEESSDESDNGGEDPCKVCPRGHCKKDVAMLNDRHFVPNEDLKDMSPSMRLAAAQHEHIRFFNELKAIWNELASWKEEQQLSSIWIHIYGLSVYDFVGPEICEGEFLDNKSLLEFSCLPVLPSLMSVRSLTVREETGREIDLWPVIVTCRVASSLPMLECLDIVGVDTDRQWPRARRSLRHSLANQIATLPNSLKTLHLALEFHGIRNHQVQPPSLLVEAQDHLSRSLRNVSTHLTTLALRLGELSPSLFWVPDAVITDVCATVWPNLRILDISTGLERASGDYWLRPAADYPEHERYDWPDDEEFPEDSDDPDDITDADRERWRAMGSWPVRRFLTRPEPAFFDELAMSISCAANYMPKLEYMDLEFNATHQGRAYGEKTFLSGSGSSYGGPSDFHHYQGWSFYYRASNSARFASEYPKMCWFQHEPGLDRTNIERPRTEWVVQCPYGDLQWNEPEAAKELWRKRCSQIDFDVITLNDDGTAWERRRDGNLLPFLGKDFATVSPGRHDLKAIPEGVL